MLSLLTLSFISQASVQAQIPALREDPAAPANAPAGNRPVLKEGSQGEAVSELQALLKLLGFYTGAIDGVYRESTGRAVSAFQQSAGLQSDGIVGAETWAKLLPPSPPVRREASGSVTPSPTPANPASTAPAAPASNGSAAAITPLSPGASSSFPSPTAVSPAAPAPTAQIPTLAPANSPSPASPPASSPSSPPASSSPAVPSRPESGASASVDLPILRIGTRGTAVIGLQERLKAIGLFKGAIDGVFGAETQEAVKAAQRNFNLDADGIVGPATWLALLR